MAAKRSQKRLFGRVFGKKWKDLSTGHRIAILGVGVAIISGIAIPLMVQLWPSGAGPTARTIPDVNGTAAVADSNSVAMAVGGHDNIVVGPHGTYVEAPQIDVDALVTRAMAASKMQGRLEERLSQSEREKEDLTEQLTAAIRRIAELEAQGGSLEAAEAIREIRASGDTGKLLGVLLQEDKRLRGEETRLRDERVELNREIVAVAYLRGEFATAKEAINAILAVEPNNRFAINSRGKIHRLQGRLADAERDFWRTMELARDDADRAVALGDLGVVYRTRGDLNRAEQMHRQALQLDEKLGSLQGMANQYVNLGIVYATRGDLGQAEHMFRKALEIDENLGRLDGVANVYVNLGNVYGTRGDLGQAERMYRRALELDEKLGWLEGSANAYGNLGLVYATRGDLEQARKYWEKALELYTKMGARPQIQTVQGWLAELEDKE